MAATPVSFKVRFVEFADTPDARVQIFLDDAALDMNEAFWGSKYDLGQVYLAAHLLIINQKTSVGKSGSSSPITGRTVDGSSVTYSDPISAGGDPFMNSTSYGQNYSTLKKHLGSGACVI